MPGQITLTMTNTPTHTHTYFTQTQCTRCTRLVIKAAAVTAKQAGSRSATVSPLLLQHSSYHQPSSRRTSSPSEAEAEQRKPQTQTHALLHNSINLISERQSDGESIEACGAGGTKRSLCQDGATLLESVRGGRRGREGEKVGYTCGGSNGDGWMKLEEGRKRRKKRKKETVLLLILAHG